MLHAEVEGDERAIAAALASAAERAGLVVSIDDDDAQEVRDRAGLVLRALESCHEELIRLEIIPTQDADDVNALSSAKGFVSRARNALRARFA